MSTQHHTPLAHHRIGVFDSGVGGLSVLKALHQRLPAASLHYVADSAHAPYGERDAAHVVERSLAVVQHLVQSGADVVVIACNTATALAAQAVRGRWPGVPIVGIEPGVKPAALAHPNGRIGVMATRATLGSERFAALLNKHRGQAHWHLEPCPGLAAAIESGDLEGDEVRAKVLGHAQALLAAQVDTVVLGCTHYPFIAHQLQAILGPQVSLLDTAVAVAEQVARQCATRPEQAVASREITLETTGDETARTTLQRLSAGWLASPLIRSHTLG